MRGLIPWRFGAALAVAVLIQVGTNYANDYSDGVRGTDSAQRVGPLRLVGSGLARPAQVKQAALVAFGLAGLAGLALAAAISWWLLAVGAVSFAAGWLYTGGPAPYGYHGLGELFVFVFFGVVATVGSAYVQVEDVTVTALVASVPVGFLATALLVVNNLRDIPTDSAAGKVTLAVRIGDRATRVLYAALVIGAIGCAPLVAVVAGDPLATAAVLASVPAASPIRQVLGGRRGPDLIPVLTSTGQVQLLYGALLAAGLLV